MHSKNKIEIIQTLRGIASLMVTWFHFTDKVSFFPLRASGMYGGYGIDIFFVISGFIIPYALHRSGYQIKDFWTFFLKRVIRLEPPYIASILIVIALFLSTVIHPWLQGKPHDPFIASPLELALHIGYLNGYFGVRWLNAVYWTLAVESQYYILIGLLFPLLASKRAWLRIVTFVALASLSLVYTKKPYIGTHVFLFLMGILTWHLRAGLIKRYRYIAALVVLIVCAYLRLTLVSAMAGSLTVLAILFGDTIGLLKSRVLLFLGDISYSLYLVHFSAGIHFMNIYQSKMSTNGSLSPVKELIMVLGATFVSILVAYALYRLVELPARKAASSISYKHER